MAVNTEISHVEYVGTGLAGSNYVIPFKFLRSGNVDLLVDGSIYIGDASIIGEGEEAGGYVVIVDAIPITSTLRIERNTPITQPYEYEEGDRLRAETIEENHDHTILAMQTLKRCCEESRARIVALEAALSALTNRVAALEAGTGVVIEPGYLLAENGDIISTEDGFPLLNEAAA